MKKHYLVLALLALALLALPACSQRQMGLSPLEYTDSVDEDEDALPAAPTFAYITQPPIWSPGDSLPAFPGAEGAGATALIACRGILPLVTPIVTNLNTSGPGSLTEALLTTNQSDNYAIVTFAVAGTIGLPNGYDGAVVDDNGCVYVAGQTGQGGIQIIGRGGGGGRRMGSDTGASDWVIRYLRGRNIIDTTKTNDGAGWFVRNAAGTQADVIFDHVSLCCGNDEILSLSDQEPTATALRITLSNNIIAGGAAHHPAGGIVGAGSYPNCNASGASVFKNFYSATGQRSPPNVGSAPACAEFVSNFMWNVRNRQSTVSDSTHTDYHDNGTDDIVSQSGKRWSINIRISLPIDCIPGGAPPDECIKVYVADNSWVEGETVIIGPTDEQWDTVCDENAGGGNPCGSTFVDIPYYRSLVPLFGVPKYPITVVPTVDVREALIGIGTFDVDNVNVGANGWLNCDALSWHQDIDDVDQFFLDRVFTPQQILLSNDYGDYAAPSAMSPLTTCADDDNDGMPNAFELICGGDATSLVPGGDISGDGYNNLEEWINGTNFSGRRLNWTDESNDEDGFRVKRDKGSGFVVIATLGPNASTYFDIDARPGDDYKVVAFNDEGESPPTMTVAAACR